jgi:hypothetical protein
MKKDPLEAWKEIENKPRIVKYLGGERCRPKQNAGLVQLVVGRAPVGEDATRPRYPAAYLQLDLGIVPSAQESTTISNWLQDDIIAKLQAAHPKEGIDDKSIGVFYTTLGSSGGGLCTWCTRRVQCCRRWRRAH